MDRLDLLLDEKFDIDVKQYWSLSVRDKNQITKIIIDFYLNNFKMNRRDILVHMSMLDFQVDMALEDELYEKAEILKRVIIQMKKMLKSTE